jgi:hypothetical protein
MRTISLSRCRRTNRGTRTSFVLTQGRSDARTESADAEDPRSPETEARRSRPERQIALSVGVSRSTVAEHLRRAGVVGITWPVPDGMGGDADFDTSSTVLLRSPLTTVSARISPWRFRKRSPP